MKPGEEQDRNARAEERAREAYMRWFAQELGIFVYLFIEFILSFCLRLGCIQEAEMVSDDALHEFMLGR